LKSCWVRRTKAGRRLQRKGADAACSAGLHTTAAAFTGCKTFAVSS